MAGFNAGYGSSREQAPQALKYAGVAAVVAKSFARIFFRNCFNVGLPAIVCPAFVDAVAGGEVAEIDLEKGVISLAPDGAAYPFARPPAFLLDYIRAGGLMLYLKSGGQKPENRGQN